MSAEKSTDIDPARVQQWLGENPDLQLIDVREPYEHEAGHIEGTRLIGLVELSSQAASVDRGRPVVFYCRVGGARTWPHRRSVRPASRHTPCPEASPAGRTRAGRSPPRAAPWRTIRGGCRWRLRRTTRP